MAVVKYVRTVHTYILIKLSGLNQNSLPQVCGNPAMETVCLHMIFSSVCKLAQAQNCRHLASRLARHKGIRIES